MLGKVRRLRQLVFEQDYVLRLRLPAGQPHPCFGDVRIGVEPTRLVADGITVLTAHRQLVLGPEQVVLDPLDLGAIETRRTVGPRRVRQVRHRRSDVGIRIPEPVVRTLGPLALRVHVVDVTGTHGATGLGLVVRALIRMRFVATRIMWRFGRMLTAVCPGLPDLCALLELVRGKRPFVAR